MKNVATPLLVVLCSLFAVSNAAVDYDDLANYDTATPQERDLITFNVNQQCAQRLSKCQAETGGAGLPLAEWTEKMDTMSADHSQMEQLANIVSEVPDTDFRGLVDSVKALSAGRFLSNALKPLSTLVSQMGKLRPESDIRGTIEALKTVGESMQSFFRDTIGVQQVTLDQIIQIITFVLGLLIAIQGGPVAIFVFIAQQIIKYLTNNARDVATVALVRNADADCFSALMQCNYVDMMTKIVPATMEATILVPTRRA